MSEETSLARDRDQDAGLSAGAVTGEILSAVTLNFICYLSLGLPLAVLPGYVHLTLGHGSMLAGLIVSVQYLATFLTRPFAGRMADALGPKRTVLWGLAACCASGLFLTAGAASPAWLGLVWLFMSRFALGFGESGSSTGAIMWGMRRVGTVHTARVISWNGITSYGGMALGAPLGVAIDAMAGLGALGLLIAALGLLGLFLAARKEPVALVPGRRLSFHHVLGQVLPYGLGLALGSAGFGAIAAFVTLFYASHDWADAAYALSAFGLCFMAIRLVFARSIDRVGGYPVAIISFAVESVGLALIWQAGTPAVALIGAALAGAGLSLVFPALAVEALAPIPSGNRGAALAAYTVFFDLALGVTGPVAGAIVAGFGYGAVFLVMALAALAAMALTSLLYRRTRPVIIE